MATLTPTITLTSTDATIDQLAFSVTDSLSVTSPLQSMSKVVATATGGDNIVVPLTGGTITYFYCRHTGTTDGTTATTQLVDVEETGDAAFARLGPGEFMFLPFCHHAGNVGIQFQVAHASNVQMEYAFWTKS
ncbi:hypothetical protein [uncultured virus]|uniref:Uncharacterized protein n=1 Tax=uncultured virus TaxID=340016 RepID=A0A218MMR2_9VIRU|nr:hypothetical protein [uncultured virus]|tara:strand:+ start:59 stop:457 length:399 start_codon:yes stop_codon:yes gene_type:complete